MEASMLIHHFIAFMMIASTRHWLEKVHAYAIQLDQRINDSTLCSSQAIHLCLVAGKYAASQWQHCSHHNEVHINGILILANFLIAYNTGICFCLHVPLPAPKVKCAVQLLVSALL